MIYRVGEIGEDLHEFTAYDAHGRVLGVHRIESFYPATARQSYQVTSAQKFIIGEQARRLARNGNLSSRAASHRPWRPEEVCVKIEKIVWVVSGLNEGGECWQEFTAYDASGKQLGTHRVEGL